MHVSIESITNILSDDQASDLIVKIVNNRRSLGCNLLEELALEGIIDEDEVFNLLDSNQKLEAEEQESGETEDSISYTFDLIIDGMDNLINDEIALNEAFNNWSDSECKEGNIGQEQYNQYEYVGKYS